MMLTASILKGSRIYLTPLEDHHIEDMHDYSSNPLFFKYMELLPHHDISDTKAYFYELKTQLLELEVKAHVVAPPDNLNQYIL